MRRCLLLTIVTSLACSQGTDGPGFGAGDSGDGEADTGETSAGDGDADTDETSAGDSDDGGGVKYDVGPGDVGAGGGGGDPCKVTDDGDAPGPCDEQAPPDSFDPIVQWEWWGEGDEIFVHTTPLVANLTDDNDDGEIDLCDVPDIVVAAYSKESLGLYPSGHLYVLSGDTGDVLLKIDTAISPTVEPAIGDIDGDGLLEIVTGNPEGQVVAFEHDGAQAWAGDGFAGGMSSVHAAVALADLDNDGDVEIMVHNLVADHEGTKLFGIPQGWNGSAAIAADLDGDGDLEVIGTGSSARHHDASQHYYNTNIGGGFPHVADLAGDADPEILITQQDGLTLAESDGTIIYADLRPTGDPNQILTTWTRPAAIHDLDGDDQPEFATSSANNYTAYEADATILWKAKVSDLSGVAGGTAFDFLGDGEAEAMYGDESRAYVFDGTGTPVMDVLRLSGTAIEYPTVADVDNDGSAEFVVVSDLPWGNQDPTAAVKVVGDAQNRWVRARRIWNQHTYHVTNVREDGTIPQFEPPSWQQLNTFRTQAQVSAQGGVCEPEG